MVKELITTTLLCVAIVLIALGIHASNLILCGIGGFCVGTYNSIINKK